MSLGVALAGALIVAFVAYERWRFPVFESAAPSDRVASGQVFVIQREDATTGSDSLITHAVIGYDPQTGDYFTHAFENHGHHT